MADDEEKPAAVYPIRREIDTDQSIHTRMRTPDSSPEPTPKLNRSDETEAYPEPATAGILPSMPPVMGEQVTEDSAMIELGTMGAPPVSEEPSATRPTSSIVEGHNVYINDLSRNQIAMYMFMITVLFVLFCLLGSLGPQRLHNAQITQFIPVSVLSKNPIWFSGITFQANKPNFFFMEMSLENKASHTVTVTLQTAIQVDMHQIRGGPLSNREIYQESINVVCPAQGRCNTEKMLYFPAVAYEEYKVFTKIMNPISDWYFAETIYFDYTYKNSEYAKFEAAWRYAFTVMSLIALVAYVYVFFFTAKPRKPTVEQNWVQYLLILLLFLNAPWYGWSMTGKHFMLVFICALGQAVFIAYLLLFWLILLDLVSQDEDALTDQTCFYGKAAYVLFGASMMCAYFTWLTWHQYQDATVNAEEKLGAGYAAIKYLLVIYILIYIMWLTYYLCRACRNIMDLSQRMISLLAFTILTMLGILSCLLVQWSSGEEEYNAPVFVALLALCNLYIFGLAFFCQPVKPTVVNLTGLVAPVPARRVRRPRSAQHTSSTRTNDTNPAGYDLSRTQSSLRAEAFEQSV